MTISHNLYVASGLLKFDRHQADYFGLLELARTWAKNSAFQSIVVRRTSNHNFAIQFVYSLYIKKSEDYIAFGVFKTSVEHLFGLAFYASDICEFFCDDPDCDTACGLIK